MDKYEVKARAMQDDRNWPNTDKGIGEMLAAFGRECAAEAYEDAERIVCRYGEVMAFPDNAVNAEKRILAKAAALRGAKGKA